MSLSRRNHQQESGQQAAQKKKNARPQFILHRNDSNKF